MPLFLGVDLGTSSLKAAVLDEKGDVVARAKVPSVMNSPEKDFYEVDAEATWWDGFLSLCTEAGKIVSLREIAAVCVSSVCASFVPVDEGGVPMHDAILYGIDKRASRQIERLNRHYGAGLAERLGGMFTTHSILPKAIWLKEERPDAFRRTKYFMEPNNFVTFRLTGERAWDYPSAAAAGLVDREKLTWAEDIFNEQGVSTRSFAELRWPLSVLGSISEDASARTGLPAGIPVITGACDINAEAAAAGALSVGECVVVFGSTVSILLNTERPVRLPGFVSGVSVVEGMYRLGAATSSGSRFLQWVYSIIRGGDGKSVSSPTGILMVPWLDGARTPFHDPMAKMLFQGMDSGTSGGALLRAGKEALGYELDSLFAMLEQAAPVPETISVSGGLSNDVELMELVSAITGKKLRLHPSVDAACGDALLAAAGSGYVSLADCGTFARGARMISPDMELHARFRPFVGRFREMTKQRGVPVRSSCG